MKKLVHRRNTCRACLSHDLKLIFNLKPTPIGDAYVTVENLDISQPSFPIDLFICNKCGLAQLTDVIDPKVLYGDYIYQTGSSSGLSEHFNAYATHVVERVKLTPNSLVVDIGSNDGTLLRSFKEIGMKVLGIEPASHIAGIATSSGIDSIPEFFSPALAEKIVQSRGNAKLITANNVFANIDDLISWVDGINILLAEDGVFVFESYYLSDLIENMVFDFIYHEHLSSFSVKPIKTLFENAGLKLVAVERVATKGGSLRYFVQRRGGPLKDDESVAKLLAHEETVGVYNPSTYIELSNKIDVLRKKTKNFLSKAKEDGKSIVGFGASITGTTLIYHYEIGKYLDFLVDDNVAKQGRFSPGLHLPVYSPEVINKLKPDYIVLLAWRFAEEIINKNIDYINNGGIFIIPNPEFRLCQK